MALVVEIVEVSLYNKILSIGCLAVLHQIVFATKDSMISLCLKHNSKQILLQGPLTYTDKKTNETVVYGVVSRPGGAGYCVSPAIYTKVSYYKRWIEEVMNSEY